jgi:hypothetical protein
MQVTNEGVAHQWASMEGWKLYKHQFGPSEIDNFLGTVREYPGGANNLWIEGVYDQDIRGENPFGYTATVNHPSLRHFWSPRSTSATPGGGNYSRDFDDGLLNSDSAANMAMKFFTGGYGLTGALDSAWDDGQDAVVGQGITDLYLGNGVAADKGKAYYWFGQTVHLLQDIAMPAHALADSHQEGVAILPNDPDPVHDYVDGKEFDDNAGNGLPYADFDDVNPTRYQMWAFQPGGAVGRAGVAASMLSAPLPSPMKILSDFNNSVYPAETLNSVPNNANQRVLPYYLLFAETAREGALFDSKDYPGQSDRNNRNRDHRTIDLTGSFYNNWTRVEIEEVADHTYPTAMYATATAIRYFYSQVDSTAPMLAWNGLTTDSTMPLHCMLAPGQSTRIVSVDIDGMDDVSGVDLDGFTFRLQKRNGNVWLDLGLPLTTGDQASFGPLGVGDYRIWTRVENGAGLTGDSPFGYFSIAIPEPATVTLLAAAVFLFRRREV